jgi:ribosomal protein S18
VYRFCADKTLMIDYKDVRMVSQFVTERGKMTPSHITGNCAPSTFAHPPLKRREASPCCHGQ